MPRVRLWFKQKTTLAAKADDASPTAGNWWRTVEPTSTPYDRPQLYRMGRVTAVTQGSASSGTSDANSQYYW